MMTVIRENAVAKEENRSQRLGKAAQKHTQEMWGLGSWQKTEEVQTGGWSDATASSHTADWVRNRSSK